MNAVSRMFRSSRGVVSDAGVKYLVALCVVTAIMSTATADDSYDLAPIPEGTWRLATDQVMGGISDGDMSRRMQQGEPCFALRGTVRTENNGGFIQIINEFDRADSAAEGFAGITFEAVGNGETYNLHLRTTDLWLPWQSYRASFATSAEWNRVYLPFADFSPYRTTVPLRLGNLRRIAVVAIGRAFDAEVCVRSLAYYRPSSRQD